MTVSKTVGQGSSPCAPAKIVGEMAESGLRRYPAKVEYPLRVPWVQIPLSPLPAICGFPAIGDYFAARERRLTLAHNGRELFPSGYAASSSSTQISCWSFPSEAREGCASDL